MSENVQNNQSNSMLSNHSEIENRNLKTWRKYETPPQKFGDKQYTYKAIRNIRAEHWWLTPVILLGRLRSGGMWFKASTGK
jgi:hypothetical protein